MKFMFLIYHDEKTLDALPEREMQALVDSALDYDEEIRRSGHYIVANALQRARTARTIRVRGGKVVDHRRPVRRDQGAARRLLPDRGQGPERGDPGRRRGFRRPGIGSIEVRPIRELEQLLAATRAVSEDRPSRAARDGGRGLPRRVAPRPRHADPPARRLRPRRGGAARGLRAPRSSSGRATACRPIRAPGWSRPAASRRSTRMRRRARFDASLASSPSGSRPTPARRRPSGRRGHRGRPAAADLHLLPPGAAAGRAGGADAARGLRPHHRGDRARLPHRARRRWRSASCAPRRRSATRASPTRCRRAPSCPSGWTRVLHVIYLVFNEGYSASSGESLTRADLSGEAIRLGRLLVELLPEPEAIGLLALMLLHESRRAARTSPDGELDAARRPGPLALEPRADRRGRGAGRARARLAPLRPVHAAGGDRGGARRGARRRRDRLGADRRPLRRARCASSRRRWSS